MGLQRELTKATNELGDVRMTVCRSTLASDKGEMDRARFLLNFSVERGVENLEPRGDRRGYDTRIVRDEIKIRF